MATIKTKWSIGDKVFVFHSSTIRFCIVKSINAYVSQEQRYNLNKYGLTTPTGFNLGDFEEAQLHKSEAAVIKAIKRA